MARKPTKESREAKYEAILSKQGLSLEGCSVLRYEFPSEGLQQKFHYLVMRSGILIRIYDGVGEVARVVVDDKRAASVLDSLAKTAGAKNS